MVTAREYVDRKAQAILGVMKTQTRALNIEEPESWNFGHIQYNIFRQSEILGRFCRLAEQVGVNCDQYLEEARELRQPYLKFWTRVA